MKFGCLLKPSIAIAIAAASTAALALTAGQGANLSVPSQAAPNAHPEVGKPSIPSDSPRSRFRTALHAWEQREYPAAAQSLREAESWIRVETTQAIGEGRLALDAAGTDLSAAGSGLVAAASWAGSGVNAAVVRVDAMSEALANEIAAGENWTRKEVASAFEALGYALDTLGNAIAAPAAADTWAMRLPNPLAAPVT